MAKAQSLGRKVELTRSEEMTKKAQKALSSLLSAKGNSLADCREFANRMNADLDVITQTGDAAGKRFPGSANHEPETLIQAFLDVQARGNIVKAS
jgi:hypothetical protein